MNRYVAHESPSKSRIFALSGERNDELKVVTTLGADDVSRTAALLAALNDLETNATTEALDGVLAGLPQAVDTAVRRHVAASEDRAHELHTAANRTTSIRLMYFSALDDELEEYIEGAYNLGLGIRLTNEVDRRGRVGWILELFAEEEFVPAGESVRTWPLPSNAPLLKTWTSERHGHRGPWLPVLAEAVGLASDASQQGRWVRVHTVLRGDGPDEFNGSSTSEFVVDVFDAAIPLDPESEDESATDSDDIGPGGVAKPVTGSRHQRDHHMIAKAITEDWLADSKLFVHLARGHNMRVEDVSNEGLAVLIDRHDRAHGGPCFEEAENRNPDDELRRGLAFLRERRS